jgi:hypothetical protein
MNKGSPRRRALRLGGVSRLEALLLLAIVAMAGFAAWKLSGLRAGGGKSRLSGPDASRAGAMAPAGEAALSPEEADALAEAAAEPLDDAPDAVPRGASPGALSSIPLPGATGGRPAGEGGMAAGSPPTPSNVRTALQARGASPVSSAVEEILGALAKVEAMEWGPEADRSLQALVKRLAAADPRAAMEYALGLGKRRAAESAVRSVLTQWMRDNPQEAFAWVSGQQTGRVPIDRDAISRSLAESDPNWALERVWQVEDEGLRANLLSGVCARWTRDGDPRRIMSLYEQAQTSEDRRVIAGMLAQGMGAYWPQDVVAWINTVTDAEAQRTAIDRLVSTWGYDQPREVADWLSGIADTRLRREELGRLMRTWAPYDAAGAAEWLVKQSPPSATLDPAIGSLVRTVMHENPPAAMMWAQTIQDQRERWHLMMHSGEEWMRTDPAAARQYINRTDLPPSMKERALRTNP